VTELRDGPCPPEEISRFEEERRISRWHALALSAMAGVMVLLVASLAVAGRRPPGGDLLRYPGLATGMLLFASGMVNFARSRGRHGAWGLLGLGFLLGWVVIRFLPPLCRWCGRQSEGRSACCDDCSGGER
jgi:hypothetical protein